MKKKIFFRFFVVSIVIVLLMFVFGIIAVNLNTKNIISQRLKEETELAASLLNSEDDFSGFAKYEDNSELRITIFDLEGNVLYESDTNSKLENHADREEVKNALAGAPSTVERYSETFKCDMTYYATLTELSNGVWVILRLAVRSSEITPYITALIPLLVLVLIVSLVLSFVRSRYSCHNRYRYRYMKNYRRSSESSVFHRTRDLSPASSRLQDPSRGCHRRNYRGDTFLQELCMRFVSPHL